MLEAWAEAWVEAWVEAWEEAWAEAWEEAWVLVVTIAVVQTSVVETVLGVEAVVVVGVSHTSAMGAEATSRKQLTSMWDMAAISM